MKITDQVLETLKGLLKKENRRQLYKYMAIGLSAVIIEFLSFNLLMMIEIDGHDMAHILLFPLFDYTVTGTNLCQSISMLLGTIFSYTMNRKWSFKTKNPIIPEITRFGILFIFNLIITNIVIRLIQATGIDDWICKICVQGMMVFWNFLIYKLVIFKPYNNKKD